MKHIVVYCSPNGSTRHVAELIAARLSELGNQVEVTDLGRRERREGANTRLCNTTTPFCLWVGSPVYVDHMVPPVEEFIEKLPSGEKCHAVPFVTWGGVNSGVALHEMGRMLTRKGYALLGAAKVLAKHSSMWASSSPLGLGHPNAEDDAAVQSLVETAHERLSGPVTWTLPLDVLDYQPHAVKAEALMKSISVAKQFYQDFKVDTGKCSQCGECAEICPAGAITLDPTPQIGEECFLCFKCVRECPEKAFPLDTSAAEQRIRAMAAARQETPPTRIFS